MFREDRRLDVLAAGRATFRKLLQQRTSGRVRPTPNDLIFDQRTDMELTGTRQEVIEPRDAAEQAETVGAQSSKNQ